MAIYEYQCKNPHCGKKFELKRSIVEFRVAAVCPTCGEQAERAFFSAPNVVIK